MGVKKLLSSFILWDLLVMNPWLSLPQGSQAQLKEVWEELDGPNRFNPKTFFILHGKVERESRTQANTWSPGLSGSLWGPECWKGSVSLMSWGLRRPKEC